MISYSDTWIHFSIYTSPDTYHRDHSMIKQKNCRNRKTFKQKVMFHILSQLAQYLTFDKTFITALSPTVQIQQQNKTFCAIFNETKYIWFKAFQISLLTIKGQLTESHFCLIFQTPQTMIRHFFALMLPETFFEIVNKQCSLKFEKQQFLFCPRRNSSGR